MIYDILAGNKLHLREIARSLKETITLKKMIDRLSRNFNHIINKWCLSILKLFEVGKKMSLRKKRYCISINARKYLEQILSL